MTLRYLDALFRPKSIAVVGASNRPKSIGSVVMNNLLKGGFLDPILPVNPRYAAVAGVLAYPSVSVLPRSPDLAIVCTPPKTVPDYIFELGVKGTKTVLIMSTDLDKYTHDSGKTLQSLALEIAQRYSMRILGPNCLGVIIPHSKLNASFGHANLLKGQIAFVSQSDSLGIAVLDWAQAKGIGFSHFISLGDSLDIDFADVINYLGSDPYTSSILLYIEKITNARKFISAARSSSRNKPVVVMKSGHIESEKEISPLPNGMYIPSDKAFEAVFRRAGMLRVNDVAELFDAVETMARSKPLRGDKLAILSNGWGPAVMAKDILDTQGGNLASFSELTLQNLQESLDGSFFGTNPVRLIDHATSDIYAQALDILLRDSSVNAVLVIHVPSAFVSSEDIAGTIVNSLGRTRKNVYTVWLGEEDAAQARKMFALAGIPTYETPDQAVRLFMDMVRYRRSQEMLMQTPDALPKEFTPEPDAARAIIKNALSEGRTRLSESETKEILSVYTIPVVETRVAETVEEAQLIAGDLGYPVALKIASPDIKSKMGIGGTVLDVESSEEIEKAAQAILSRVRQIKPEASLEGFIVQRMARRPEAYELMMGITRHREFGPIVIFGQGGPAASIIQDWAVGLPPLNMALARELMQRTRIYKILQQHPSQREIDLKAIRLTLVQLSQMIIDIPEIMGLSINPVLADSNGVLVLKALIEISPKQDTDSFRLAIRPYPDYLEEKKSLHSGVDVVLRPIRPEDEHSHDEFFQRLKPEDRRMRFFSSVHEFSHTQLARYTQIDYDREMAFVAILDKEGKTETLGVIRAYYDPDNITGEFAVVIRTDMKGQGLGTILMDKMIRYSQRRGVRELNAYTLRENEGMQALANKYGFEINKMPDDPETVELRLQMAPS
jgi:acetyltransferase